MNGPSRKAYRTRLTADSDENTSERREAGREGVRLVSAESHYKSNLRDLYFNLFEFNDLGQRVLGQPPFTTLDEAAARALLVQMDKMAKGELSASFAAADRSPPELGPDGEIRLSEPIKRTLRAYLD